MAALKNVISKLDNDDVNSLEAKGYAPRGTGFVDTRTGRFVSGEVIDAITEDIKRERVGRQILDTFGVYTPNTKISQDQPSAVPVKAANDNRESISIFNRMLSALNDIKRSIQNQTDLQKAKISQDQHDKKEDKLELSNKLKEPERNSNVIAMNGQEGPGSGSGILGGIGGFIGSLLGKGFGGILKGGSSVILAVARPLLTGLLRFMSGPVGWGIMAASVVAAIGPDKILGFVKEYLPKVVDFAKDTGKGALNTTQSVVDWVNEKAGNETQRSRYLKGIDETRNRLGLGPIGSHQSFEDMTAGWKAEPIQSTTAGGRIGSDITWGINQMREATGMPSSQSKSNHAFLNLIGAAEGTDKGRGYNETLAYGAFTGGPVNLTNMTLDEVDSLQTKMLKHPKNTFNSSAVGRYQIVQKTLRSLRKQLNLSGNEKFTPELQDQLALRLAKGRGDNPAGLRNEWEGLRRVSAEAIKKAYSGIEVAGTAIAKGAGTAGKKAIEVAKDAVDNVKDIIGISVGKSEGKKYKYEWDQGSKPLERSAAIADYNNKTAKDPTIINNNISSGSTKDKPTQPASRGLSVPNPNANAGMDYLYYFTGKAA